MFDFTPKDYCHHVILIFLEEDIGDCDRFFMEVGECNKTLVGFFFGNIYIVRFFALDKMLLIIILEF